MKNGAEEQKRKQITLNHVENQLIHISSGQISLRLSGGKTKHSTWNRRKEFWQTWLTGAAFNSSDPHFVQSQLSAAKSGSTMWANANISVAHLASCSVSRPGRNEYFALRHRSLKQAVTVRSASIFQLIPIFLVFSSFNVSRRLNIKALLRRFKRLDRWRFVPSRRSIISPQSRSAISSNCGGTFSVG